MADQSTFEPDMSASPMPGATPSPYAVLDFDDAKATVQGPNGQPMTIARTPGLDSMLGIGKLTPPAPIPDAAPLPAGPTAGSHSGAAALGGLPVSNAGTLDFPPPATPSAEQAAAGAGAPSPKLELPKVLQKPGTGASAPSGGGMLQQGFKLRMQGIEGEKQAAQTSAEAEASGYQLQQEHLRGQARAQSDFAIQHQNELGEIQKWVSAQNDDLQKEGDRVGAMKVDNDRYYKEHGTGARILHAFAAFAGALGAGLTGGANHAQKIIDETIGRDINAQVHEIQNAKDTFSLKRNAIAQKMGQGLTFLQAKQATQYMQYAAAETKLKALMAGEQNQQVLANYQQMLAQLQEKKGQQMQEYGTLMAQMAAARAGKQPDSEKFVPRGNSGFYASSKESAEKLREGLGAVAAVKSDTARMRQLLEEHGNESAGDVSKEYDVLQSRIMLNLNKAAGAGALDNGSLPFLTAQVPNATAFFGRGQGSLDTLKALDHSLSGELEAKLQAYGGF